MCCGPYGIILDSTHPLLKRFSFTSCSLFDNCDFLARHPGIETLFLETEQSFCIGTDSSLRAVNADEWTLVRSFDFLNSKITHLRLREIDEYAESTLIEAIRAMSSTLRCLEIEVLTSDDDPLPPCITTLFGAAPALEELAIIKLSSSPLNWISSLLTDLLNTLGPAAPLRALRICCNEALSPERLEDFGPLPPCLKYIGWDVYLSSLIYVIERTGDKNSVGTTLTRSRADDWTAEGVLPFLGEPWTER
ncbi:hypothetical protein B0H19DRAFT_156582 [Mycena capillaripes]|nr:hypothetical protein B0H19DRAFT_156582 [Mycena capillaripes]